MDNLIFTRHSFKGKVMQGNQAQQGKNPKLGHFMNRASYSDKSTKQHPFQELLPIRYKFFTSLHNAELRVCSGCIIIALEEEKNIFS